MNHTPLRYPGGKSVMTGFLNSFIKENQMESVIYAEPYAGGVGAGINLLLNGLVSKLYINDASPAIYSFWYSLINYSDDFLHLFDTTNVNLNEWLTQKMILINRTNEFNNSKECVLELGFATFFLNRCNRSGILNAGPIGGITHEGQKKATYKIDARFNKIELRKRLEAIILKKEKISVFNDDALDFLKKRIKTLSSKKQINTLVYLDPPYYVQGSSLYLNYYKHKDHVLLSKYLKKDSKFRWLLSYDNELEIRRLYSTFDKYKFELLYSADTIKLGNELLVNSSNSVLPISLSIRAKNNKTPSIDLMRIS